MMARSHVPFAMASWWVYGLATGFPITGIDSLVAAIGGLLPDIDHPQSALGRRIPWVSIPLSAVFGHRGFTHSLLAVLMVMLLLIAIPIPASWQWIVYPLCIGYLSHLLGDAVTASGIPLLYPWRRKFGYPLLPINTIKETALVASFLLIILTIGGAGAAIWQNTVDTLPFPVRQWLE
jgi:inner membrane protein